MTIKEAASAWGITERRVNELCKAGRISGAYKEGRQWFIPDGTQKPMDKRGHRSAGKARSIICAQAVAHWRI